MKLARRVTVWVGLVMLGLAVVLFATTAAALLYNADGTDRDRAFEESERVFSAIEMRLHALEGDAVDWARWNESYGFMLGADPEYGQRNISKDTFSNLDVDMIALFDSAGEPSPLVALNESAADPITMAAASQLLRTQTDLNLVLSGEASHAGIYQLTDGRLALLGAGAILPSEGGTSPVGTLVMGRVLGDAELDAIAAETQLDIAVAPHTGDALASAPEATLTPDRVEVRRSFQGSDGSAVADLVVSRPRRALDNALDFIAYLALATAGLVGATTLLIHAGMRRGVLTRLGSLEDSVARIRATGVPEELKLSGDDELSTLAHDIECLVFELDDAKRSVESSRDELNERVIELSRVVEELTEQSARRKEAEAGRADSEERYASLIENLADVVFTMDGTGRLDFVSAAAESLLGVDPVWTPGTDISTLVGGRGADLVMRRLRRGVTAEGARLTIDAHAAEGNPLDLEVILTPLPNEEGYQGILRDITAQRRHENELLHMASHDFLTGLWNRRRFEDELARVLEDADDSGEPGAVFWLDLDGFKDVNDTLGHKAGDELLVRFARRLSETVRSDSVIARLGGDEFAIVLPSCDFESSISAAERLVSDIGEMRFEIDGQAVRVSASLGLVHYPEHGNTLEDLLARADVAMYQAKERGRAHVVVFDPTSEWRDAVEDRQVWTEMVELALAEGGLVAYAQPITDVHTGRVVSYELLVRMLDFGGSVIPPDRFLPVAERTGMIVDIDIWMLEQAAELLVASPEADFRINVNASARTLADPRFLQELTRIVTTSSFSPSRLTIEITETTIIVDVAGVSDTLRSIKALGCRIALDDFGSGFTSFLHLKQLPVDDIKIDGSFVRNVGGNSNDQHLIRAMVEMARGLNMRTTDEFVESQANLELLRSFGVETAQGYLIGEPRPIDETVRSVCALPMPSAAGEE